MARKCFECGQMREVLIQGMCRYCRDLYYAEEDRQDAARERALENAWEWEALEEVDDDE